MRIREKRHRLPEAAYYGRKTVSFTACAENRRRGFDDPDLVAAFVPHLTDAARETGCVVPIYCFMPDHLHVVVLGLDDASRPKRAMELFKHDTGMWLAEHRPNLSWQKDFHDRIVRRSEGFAAHVRYVALNPVRAGLAPDIDSWPFTGSVGCQLSEVLLDAFWE
jgi:putative transposase